MNHKINHSNLYHGFTAVCQRLIVLAQAAVFSQPRKSTFYHPSTWQNDKSLNVIAPFNNLQNPMTKICRPINQFAGISAIGPDQHQATKATEQFRQNQFGAITILNIGRMDDHGHHQTQRIYHQMAFSARYFLARIITTIPPFEAVLIDWLSRIAALGLSSRPAWTRTRLWRIS